MYLLLKTKTDANDQVARLYLIIEQFSLSRTTRNYFGHRAVVLWT
jgi:hypothetical protein